jgi:hypothetical protein
VLTKELQDLALDHQQLCESLQSEIVLYEKEFNQWSRSADSIFSLQKELTA